ncbi:MAG: hypothetical protein ABJM82_02970 [Shimia thalassica]|uniref:hypothetical protein n=1 Tax=Shimia thalassica TaxID=1715693 RepID=UPI003299A4C7
MIQMERGLRASFFVYAHGELSNRRDNERRGSNPNNQGSYVPERTASQCQKLAFIASEVQK